MTRKFQVDNSNNARVLIDYTNRNEPVKFEVVGTMSSFKVAFNTMFSLWFMVIGMSFLLLIPVCFLSILLMHGSVSNFFSLWLYWIPSINYNIWCFIAIMGLVFGVPLILALLYSKNQRLRLQLPYINAMASPKRFFAMLKPSDIKDYKIEIPLFKNIVLDYKATGEMSKYLEKFEIIEHPFLWKTNEKFERNPWLWKATFYFSQIPSNGLLRVRFK